MGCAAPKGENSRRLSFLTRGRRGEQVKEGMVPGGAAAAVFMGGSDGEMRGDPAFSWKIQRLGATFSKAPGVIYYESGVPGIRIGMIFPSGRGSSCLRRTPDVGGRRLENLRLQANKPNANVG